MFRRIKEMWSQTQNWLDEIEVSSEEMAQLGQSNLGTGDLGLNPGCNYLALVLSKLLERMFPDTSKTPGTPTGEEDDQNSKS